MQRFWRTDNRSTWFVRNAPGIREDAIIYFKERGIRAIGCDTIACDMAVVDGVGQETTGHTTHWLPNGILTNCLHLLHGGETARDDWSFDYNVVKSWHTAECH